MTLTSRFHEVRPLRGLPKRRCLHCRRWATIQALRVDWRTLPVRYCDKHAELIIPAVASLPAGQRVGGAPDRDTGAPHPKAAGS